MVFCKGFIAGPPVGDFEKATLRISFPEQYATSIPRFFSVSIQALGKNRRRRRGRPAQSEKISDAGVDLSKGKHSC
jgi:hypothetical protein